MATCFSLSFRNLRKTSPSRSVSGETLCVKAIFDMIRNFSTLFSAAIDAHPDFVISVRRQTPIMTDIEPALPGPAQADEEELVVRITPCASFT